MSVVSQDWLIMHTHTHTHRRVRSGDTALAQFKSVCIFFADVLCIVFLEK